MTNEPSSVTNDASNVTDKGSSVTNESSNVTSKALSVTHAGSWMKNQAPSLLHGGSSAAYTAWLPADAGAGQPAADAWRGVG